MTKRKRLLYILCTVLLCFVISYAVFTGCNLPELPDVPNQETELVATEQFAGGDSP